MVQPFNVESADIGRSQLTRMFTFFREIINEEINPIRSRQTIQENLSREQWIEFKNFEFLMKNKDMIQPSIGSDMERFEEMFTRSFTLFREMKMMIEEMSTLRSRQAEQENSSIIGMLESIEQLKIEIQNRDELLLKKIDALQDSRAQGLENPQTPPRTDRSNIKMINWSEYEDGMPAHHTG